MLALIAVLGLGIRAYAVVNPVANPADDSHAYYALAKALYEEGSFGGPEFRDSSDWSPGAPLLYAAAFYATGGAREGTARIVEALLGVAAILVVFLLGHRLGQATGPRAGPRAGSAVGLLAAFAVAVYPPFIHSTGELMSEPPAILTLPAAVLAFLWASEQGRSGWAWLLPGLLFGLTAMFRPEYLFVGAAFVVLAAIRAATRPPFVAPRDIADKRRTEGGGAAGSRPGRRRSAARGAAAADRALDDPQRRRPRPRRADLDRQRQGPLRRHLPARPMANTSGSRRCSTSATNTSRCRPTPKR